MGVNEEVGELCANTVGLAAFMSRRCCAFVRRTICSKPCSESGR